MGTIQHYAIVATTHSQNCYAAFWSWAEANLTDREMALLARANSWANCYQSFVIVPDGSKEGWPDSDEGDDLRTKVIRRLRQDDFDDSSSPWEFVEVGFGELGISVSMPR